MTGDRQLNLEALKPDLREAVVRIAEMARAAGGRALLVGGAVRDLLLGTGTVKDVDVEVFGIALNAEEYARAVDDFELMYRAIEPAGSSRSTLIASIGLVDILRVGQLIQGATYRAFEPSFVISVF